MSYKKIDPAVLRAALEHLPAEFYTKDLSTLESVRTAHPHLVGHSHFHAFVGRALSELPDVEHVGSGKAGARWHQRGQGRASTASLAKLDRSARESAPTNNLPTSPSGLGPQCGSDNGFTKRMRLHQSWYRHHRLSVLCGTGPTRNSTRHYGNMLRREDGEAGLNFLTPDIHDVARARLAQGTHNVEPYRLLHNMLSSQPMCFNLFGPLVQDQALATRLARSLWGEHIAQVTDVRIEWAPEPRQEYLDDNTSFDAFIEYRVEGGGLGFVAIETKLTEPFSQRLEDRPSYRRWMGDGSPWRPDASDRVQVVRHNQLWRDHLLAWSLLNHPRSPYSEGKLVVVYHPQDENCARTVAGYRGLLQDERSFGELTLGFIMGAWEPLVEDSAWVQAFRTRYLDLKESRGA